MSNAISALRAGRLAAEALMVDRWRVYRLDTEQVDPLTGEAVHELVYEGKGRLQSYEGYEQTPEVIGHTSTVQRMSLHIPVGAYRPQVGHVAVCVESLDSNLVGTHYRMTQDAPFKTHATAYRVFVDFEAA